MDFLLFAILGGMLLNHLVSDYLLLQPKFPALGPIPDPKLTENMHIN